MTDNNVCSINGCNNQHHAQGLCNTHYGSLRRSGKFKRTAKSTGCLVHNCDGVHRSKGYCHRHYLQIRRHGKIIDHPEYCKVAGCKEKYSALGYCSKHYNRFKKHGTTDKQNNFIPNEIITYDDYAEVILLNNKKAEVARAIIDIESIKTIKPYRWHLSTGYAKSSTGGVSITMHELIIGYSRPDHENRNKLDNRRLNLRPVTPSQNIMNQSLRNDNKTGFRGVSYVESSGKYRAQIKVDGERIHIGYYDTPEEAAIEYDKAAEIYHGKFKCTNKDIHN